MGNSHSEPADTRKHKKHDADHHSLVRRALHRVQSAFPSPTTSSPSTSHASFSQKRNTHHDGNGLSSSASSHPSLRLSTPPIHFPTLPTSLSQQEIDTTASSGLQSVPTSPQPPPSADQHHQHACSNENSPLPITCKYCLPDSEHEQDRLISMHFLSKHAFGGNYASPIGSILQQPRLHHKVQPCVLDVACGTGTWLMEMASEFPNAQFYGIDIYTMYPSDIKPPNVHFIQGNVLEGLPYDDATFDFVHMSYVSTCFSQRDRRQLLHQIRRVLKPGGYVEFRDAEHFIRNAGPLTNEFQRPFARVMREVLDVDVTWASHMAEQLHLVAGMTDIHNQVVSTHYMSSSNLSNAIMNHLEAELQSYGDFLATAYHLSREEYNRICESILEECRRYRSFQNHVLVWARKRLIEDSTPASIDRFSTAPSTVASSGSPSSSHIPTNSIHSNRNDEKTSDIYQFVHGYIE
ncbi:hypothetical protein O0I10_002770 [Lichtheimia ornata]|uniref:Methyltransferase domain-containing protein n=1 Tax=Lichtheimia ornata TaxID=688661 RepID=A0AAD7XY58_9FUNG|nr:uncharacterized protein O0I10_002770 [Lichtheimia ornata]KAJ8661504.1 hypothetical protein O0I10_002770 [Lichtheimia ornata]